MTDAVSVVLSCSNCGARLEITPDIDRFVCLHCGSQQIVRRGGGIISLQPLVQGVERVQRGTDKTAAELAIPRLTKEIAEVEEELRRIESTPDAQWLERPVLDNITPVVILVGLGSVVLFLWVVNLVNVAIVATLLAAPLMLWIFSRSQREQRAEIEKWLDEVAVVKAATSQAPRNRLAMLQRKLRENQLIANS